jgi:hypothetical protein
MASLEASLSNLTALISTGELIKIVLLNDVIVDGDIGGAESGGGLGGATRPITLEGLIGINLCQQKHSQYL